MLKIINSNEEFKQSTASGVQVVDFYADWCGPCRMLAPVMEELANTYSDVDVLKVNVDNLEDLARQYGVSSIPLVVVLKDGQVVDKVLGYRPKESYAKILEKLR